MFRLIHGGWCAVVVFCIGIIIFSVCYAAFQVHNCLACLRLSTWSWAWVWHAGGPSTPSAAYCLCPEPASIRHDARVDRDETCGVPGSWGGAWIIAGLCAACNPPLRCPGTIVDLRFSFCSVQATSNLPQPRLNPFPEPSLLTTFSWLTGLLLAPSRSSTLNCLS